MTDMERSYLVARGRIATLIASAIVTVCASSASAQQVPRQGPNDVVATVGSVSITLAQGDDKALRLSAESFGTGRLSQILYEARRAAIDDIVANMLIDQEGTTRGLGRTVVIEQEIS